jgi:hypothetical protein
MKIAFLELQPWEDKYLRGRVDGAHEITALPEALERILDTTAENIAAFAAGAAKNVVR